MRWGRWVAGGLVLVGLVLAVSAVFVLLDARRAEASLRSAVTSVEKLQATLLDGDAAAAGPALAELQGQTGAAVSATRGPHWWIAAHTPFVGDSVVAVQTVASVVDSIATGALPALADAAKVLEPSALLPRDGRIDTMPFIEVAPRVIAADDAVQAAAAQLAKVDERRVIDRVAGPVTELKEMVRTLSGTTELASKASQLIPPMLGAYGQRQYALLAQSPAEIRAGGGHIGAVMLVTVDGGRITLGDRVGGGKLYSPTPVLPLTPDEELLFTDTLVTYGVSATMTPDFPRSAEITRAQWEKAFGQTVDGVMAVDPVALGYLLKATGPVRTPNGTQLDGSNAARILLNDIYKDPDIAAQDELFGDAAKAVFNALMKGSPNVSAGLEALMRSANEGRWLVWSSDPREQSLISGRPLSGEFVGERDGAPVVGVYLNDASATKMSYYLDYSATVDGGTCRADGVRPLTVTVDIGSTAPPEAAGYPPYLSGQGQVTPGHSLTNVMVYTPSGGVIDRVTVDGAEYPLLGLYSHLDMEVAQVTVDLGPGESRRLVVEMQTGAGQSDAAQLRLTPGSKEAVRLVRDSTC